MFLVNGDRAFAQASFFTSSRLSNAPYPPCRLQEEFMGAGGGAADLQRDDEGGGKEGRLGESPGGTASERAS